MDIAQAMAAIEEYLDATGHETDMKSSLENETTDLSIIQEKVSILEAQALSDWKPAV